MPFSERGNILYPREPKYLSWEQFETYMGQFYSAYEVGLDKLSFLRAGVRAEAVIDAATHGRVKQMATVPQEVEILCLELIRKYAEDESRRGITSRSQSVDGVSESENYKMDADKEAELDALIFSYLGNVTDDNGTPLLYRGCSV